jgi:hypothetical protein
VRDSVEHVLDLEVDWLGSMRLKVTILEMVLMPKPRLDDLRDVSQMALTSGLTGGGSGKWTFTFFWGTLFPASL